MSQYRLELILAILITLWLLGWLVVPVGGNVVHLLLILILVVILVRILQEKSPRSQ